MILGLTGSIAMGKSATADMFRRLGYQVFDADRAVHDLYAQNGKAAHELQKLVPEAIIDGAVDRQILAAEISRQPGLLKKVENIVHPLVHQEEKAFIADQKKAGANLIILDIPLLFEAGRDKDVDKIIVVSADPATQKKRALSRPGMTIEKFEMISSRQIPDHIKRKKADFVINSSKSLDDAFQQVKALVNKLDPETENTHV